VPDHTLHRDYLRAFGDRRHLFSHSRTMSATMCDRVTGMGCSSATLSSSATSDSGRRAWIGTVFSFFAMLSTVSKSDTVVSGDTIVSESDTTASKKSGNVWMNPVTLTLYGLAAMIVALCWMG
jgi:hypothetical protein